jgi:glycine C-acetyltransferase
MLQENIYVIGFSYPVVGKDLARIRVQVSSCHTEGNIDDCVAAFEKIGKELKVIK